MSSLRPLRYAVAACQTDLPNPLHRDGMRELSVVADLPAGSFVIPSLEIQECLMKPQQSKSQQLQILASSI